MATCPVGTPRQRDIALSFGNFQANEIGHTARIEWGERWREGKKERQIHGAIRQSSRSPELEGLEERASGQNQETSD